MRCGLIGAGIGASLSPVLHEAEGRSQGLDLRYELFDTGDADAMKTLLDDAESAGFAGLNITHPFKQQVIALLDDLSPRAEAIGAVNTVVFRDGRRHGHNTDAYGFARAYGSELSGEIVQLGAGGAGAATAYALNGLDRVKHVTVIDPDEDKLAKLITSAKVTGAKVTGAKVTAAGPGALEEKIRTADGLVNATPIGMKEHPGMPLPAELLHRGLRVVDIVYMPVETMLLRAARDRGLWAVGGTAMCAYQAAAAFELLTGHAPDTARMLRHLDAVLA
ncbi:shikimate dehydrogenase [Actinoplanes sp. LDG1-06]|uniref:Shikimate dehydrogenase n=1 Tax=Paractinoplanes ovalisporus TaxID=2810368 RepID=A0ABS2A2S6_9ACTN|nr:shikimate dehydrogenase [Actinoplanes ovalisporus]MBM2614141.1 shikimate dehydrogenase [Actinoplanes ovalisporus]